MSNILRILITTIILMALTACGGGMSINDFRGRSPELKIEDYFLGKTKAYGLFLGRSGELKRSFTVDITGTLEGSTLTLNEDFIWDDGEETNRIWTIDVQGDGRYIGRADDVVGEAIGLSQGNALNWRYLLDQKLDDGSIKLRFDDWMYLMEDGVLLNRAEVSKFGFTVGTVVLSFTKDAAVMEERQAAE